MTETVVNNSDRRIFERFSARFPAKFKDSSEGYGSQVFLRDASAGGVRIVSKERFFVEDQLALEVELPDGQQPMVLSGRVRWTKPLQVSLYDIGIEFGKVNFLQMQRLFKFTEKNAL